MWLVPAPSCFRRCRSGAPGLRLPAALWGAADSGCLGLTAAGLLRTLRVGGRHAGALGGQWLVSDGVRYRAWW